MALSRAEGPSARARARSRSAPPSSTCAARTRSTWPKTRARQTSSPADGCNSASAARSPEQVIDGWRHFGFSLAPLDDDRGGPERSRRVESDADMARRHAEVFLDLLHGEGFAQPNPRPMFPNPPGLLRIEPHSPGLRDRIWWGASSNQTARWAAELGMNLQPAPSSAAPTPPNPTYVRALPGVTDLRPVHALPFARRAASTPSGQRSPPHRPALRAAAAAAAVSPQSHRRAASRPPSPAV